MPKSRVLFTNDLMHRWIREGRGQGEGSNYKPWLRVQNFPSLGVVHRIKGMKHGRIHHLFSNLERNCFYQYEWPLSVIDMREQFALLPRDETIEIAREMGVRHPTDPRTKCPIVMTTDLFLSIRQAMATTYQPITVKYMKDLRKQRVLEKLEIERRYWAATPRNLKLRIFTEEQVSEAMIRNIQWLHPYYWPSDLYPLTEQELKKISSLLTYLLLNEDLPLRTVAQRSDRILLLESGTCLAVLRHLLANRYWEIDIRSRILTNQPLTLLTSPSDVLCGEKEVAA